MNLNGWKQPKRGRWAMDWKPLRTLVPALPHFGRWASWGMVVAGIGLVLWRLLHVVPARGALLFVPFAIGMMEVIPGGLPFQRSDPYSDLSIINVKDFLAKGDGIADDTAAITGAMNSGIAAGGAIIWFPRGTYMAGVLPSVTVPMLFQGVPGNVSTISFTGSGLTFDYGGATGYNYGVGCRDLQLLGPGSGTVTTGLTLGGASGAAAAQGARFSNCQIRNFGTGLTFAANAYLDTFDGCIFRGNGQQILTGAAGNSGEGFKFISCTFANSGTVANAVQINGAGMEMNFVGCSFDNAQVSISTGGLRCTNCHFENPGTTGNYFFVAVTGGTTSIVDSVFFQGDGAATATAFVDVQGGTCVGIANRFSTSGAVIARAYFYGGGTRGMVLGTQLLTNVTAEVVTTSTSRVVTGMSVVAAQGPPTPTAPTIALVYGAAIATDASLSNVFTVTANNGVAFTLNNPTLPTKGQVATWTIRNTSGGALGALTFGALFKIGAAWVQPATGFSRSITCHYDGANWVELTRGAADVAN